MLETEVALEVAAYAADPTALITTITVLSMLTVPIVCLTVIVLVLTVARSDRVEAIKILAPALSFRHRRGRTK
jgi:hypothetical protein